MPDPLSNHDRQRIRAELAAGRKIEAIKLYRAASGAGLAAAKAAVEALETGGPVGEQAMEAVSDDDIGAIEAAVFAGERIKAIKIYRNATGEGLKEAKDFVDALEAELRRTEPARFTAPARKGCGATVLTLLVIAALSIWFVAARCF